MVSSPHRYRVDTFMIAAAAFSLGWCASYAFYQADKVPWLRERSNILYQTAPGSSKSDEGKRHDVHSRGAEVGSWQRS